MDNFITAQGEMIVSGILSISALGIMFGVMKIISNINIYFLSCIMGA